MEAEIAALNERFGIPGAVRVIAGHGGLTKVQVGAPQVSGELYLHGGQVTSWIPAGGREVLFVSRESRFEAGRAIRGGIPVCFPWFGAKPDDPKAPSHGFVRLKTWTLESIALTPDGAAVAVATRSDEQTRQLWPFEFRLHLLATFGRALRLDLTVSNEGTQPFTCEEALHTYYSIDDVRKIRLRGLDGVQYLDKVGGSRQAHQEGDIRFVAETDRIYLDTTRPVSIEDSGQRSLHLTPDHSSSTVVWNPWRDRAKAFVDFGDDEWIQMVCVETCNVLSSAPTIQPGASHTMSVVVSVQP